MPTYLTIHQETAVDRVLLESRWSEIAMDVRAAWELTLFNLEQGRRWCEWSAPDTQTVEQILTELGVAWTEMLEVEVTTPSQWRLWQAQTRRQATQRG